MSRLSTRLAILLMLVGLLLLGACTAVAPAAAPEGEAGAASDEPVTIRFRSYTLGEVRDNALRDLITQFETENPNIQVEVELPPGDQYWDKLQTEFAGGNAPDITVNQMDWVIPGASRGMFVDLNPLMAEDGITLDDYFYPMELEWGYEGGMYGAILYAGGQAHYVNTDLLEAAGLEFPAEDWTWDDLLEYAQAMTNPEENQWGMDISSLPPPYWSTSFIHGAGGSVLNEAKDQCTLTTPEARAGLQFVADLILVHKVMPPPGTFDGQDNPFLTGKVGILFGGTWQEGDIRASGINWDFATMPINADTGLRNVQLGSNAWSILSTSQHVPEAWELVKYLSGEEGQRIMMNFGVPGLTSLVESEEYREAHAPQDIDVVWNAFGDYGHDYYPTPDANEWWSAVNQELSVIWSGEATVEEATERACAAIDEIFARRAMN
jgi:multiple sugar transport system substrate-binding protein